MSISAEYAAIMERLGNAIDESLKNEVAEAVKTEMSLKVHEEVYDAYMPKYPDSRREDKGGLSDVLNYDSRVEEGHTLIVENNTPAQHPISIPLTEVVEKGLVSYRMPFPRPFIEETEQSVDAKAALLKGLAERGFQVNVSGD